MGSEEEIFKKYGGILNKFNYNYDQNTMMTLIIALDSKEMKD
jgi:hypothetical protein